jgi:hypothetical protein
MKKVPALALAVVMLHSFSLAPLADETPEGKAKRALLASEVKAGVSSLGTGRQARVRVRLADKTEYHGHVAEIADAHFVVADARTGATAPIRYDEVKGIKGNNLSSGAKIGIGVAVAAAAAGIIIGVVRGRPREEKGPDSPCRLTGVTTPCPPGCVCIQ